MVTSVEERRALTRLRVQRFRARQKLLQAAEAKTGESVKDCGGRRLINYGGRWLLI